jgi:hypothetical protein
MVGNVSLKICPTGFVTSFTSYGGNYGSDLSIIDFFFFCFPLFGDIRFLFVNISSCNNRKSKKNHVQQIQLLQFLEKKKKINFLHD